MNFTQHKVFMQKKLIVESNGLLEPRKIHFIEGESGCGKSTFLKSICGLHPEQTGSIKNNEKELSSLKPHERGISIVFQGAGLIENLSIIDNTCLMMKLNTKSKKWPAQKQINNALFWLEKMQINDLNKKVENLSGGEKQRIALARSLCAPYETLLIDEGLSSVDESLGLRIKSHIEEYVEKSNTTCIWVSHNAKRLASSKNKVHKWPKCSKKLFNF